MKGHMNGTLFTVEKISPQAELGLDPVATYLHHYSVVALIMPN